MTNDPIIKIEQLEKSFGDLHVLKYPYIWNRRRFPEVHR